MSRPRLVLGAVVLLGVILHVGVATADEVALAPPDPAGVTVLEHGSFRVMNSLITLRDTSGSQGQNRTANEQYFVSESDYCVNTMDCDAGEVCMSNDCKSGDPHGENIRDWIYHLAIDLGASDTQAWQTLQSSPCVGSGDDSYPFRGGYRTD